MQGADSIRLCQDFLGQETICVLLLHNSNCVCLMASAGLDTHNDLVPESW